MGAECERRNKSAGKNVTQRDATRRDVASCESTSGNKRLERARVSKAKAKAKASDVLIPTSDAFS